MPCRPSIVAVVMLASAAGVLCAGQVGQAPRDAQNAAGLLLGQIVDAGTGRPVPGAVVALTTIAPAADSPDGRVVYVSVSQDRTSVVADASGHFAFFDLPRGRYSLAAEAGGYLSGRYGQRRPDGPSLAVELGDGEKLRDITIRLWRTAALNGTVLDEAGDPAVGVQVRALRRTYSSGAGRWTNSSSVLTDDRGMYRMANLVPGQYIVGVISSQTTLPASIAEAAYSQGDVVEATRVRAELTASGVRTNMTNGFRVGDWMMITMPTVGRMSSSAALPSAMTNTGRFLVYPTVFYPAARTSVEAEALELQSGDDRAGLDLRLRFVPGVRVSGTITGPDGPVPNLGVRLLPAALHEFDAESGIEVATTATGANGAFTFLGVPAGEYTLSAMRVPRPPPLAVTEAASVSGGGGVSFSVGVNAAAPPQAPAGPMLWTLLPVAVSAGDVTDLAPTLRLGLRVTGRAAFSGTRTPPAEDQVQRMVITLRPIATSPAVNGGTGRAAPDGTFTIPGSRPGRYVLGVSTPPPGWTLVSAVHAGRDVSDQPLEIESADITGVTLTFSDRMTTISGTVRNSQGRGDAESDVIAFPADHAAWKQFGVTARRTRTVRTAATGAYVISGLPPGEYYVVAVGGAASGPWQEPTFLESLIRSAVRVTLADGDVKTAELQTSVVK